MRPHRLLAYYAILLALIIATFAIDDKPIQWLTGCLACMGSFGLFLFGMLDVDE